MNAPVIHTERLTLRPHRSGDFDLFADALAAPDARYMGGPFDRGRAWSMFCCDVASWDLLGHGAWAVDRSLDATPVGQVGLNKPPSFPERELGWLIYADFRGQGYAQEAARAARKYAVEELGWETLVSYIDPENAASIKVARAIGATQDKAAIGPEPEDLVYRHPIGEACQ